MVPGTVTGSTELRRALGLLDATTLVIGCVIGAGIFRTAASIAGYLHTPQLVMAVWAVGGVISFYGALCYAELGAAYPQTGGDYVYLKKAYGPLVGFLFGWTKIFTERIGTIAILGFVFAEYTAFLLALSPLGTKLLATAAIVILTAANILGIHVGKSIQNFLTFLKVSAILGIIAIGLLFSKGEMPLVQPLAPFGSGGGVLQAFGVALVFVLWTYGGWAESAYVAQEIRNPQRNLPWSILLGLGLVTVLYLAVNWVYLLYIPLREMPGKPLVAAEVMKAMLGPVGATVTAGMVASSAFGALNGYILTSGRILMAMGEDHPLFSQWTQVDPRFATPAKALVFNAVGGIGLVWLGTFDQIVTYSTVAISIFFAMGALSVMVLRARDPNTPRPYRVWGYPATPLIFALFTGLFIVNIIFMQPKETLIGFALTALGLPLYVWSRTLAPRKVLAAVAAVLLPMATSANAAGEERFALQREEMVKTQIERRGVRSKPVLRAMRTVPRHEFVPQELQWAAYADGPLPIGEGQTISQPYIVAFMTELAEVERDEKVLEIGTGSGYQAAVLGELTTQVFTIEILPTLARHARNTLDRLGYSRVRTRVGDGYLGWPKEAPFDAILVTAAPDHLPQPLVDQLAEGGVLVIPVGVEAGPQELQRLRKVQGKIASEKMIPVSFVPLIHKEEGVE